MPIPTIRGIYQRRHKNESGFRPPLCTFRLNWARRTSWGWWDDWDDTVLQTQDSKFEPWRSEAEHATSRSRRLPIRGATAFKNNRCDIPLTPQGWLKVALVGALHWSKWAPEKKLCAACDDLNHFASMQYHSVACLHVYGRFLGSFLVAHNNLLVRLDLACRSDARHSDNWPALHHVWDNEVLYVNRWSVFF